MAVNRQYKNSVFSLEGVLFRTFLNDISFLVGQKLIVLAEHQSTINPNMEVETMLYDEWNLEDALVVEREEGREEGIEKVARTALAEGAPLDFIQRITGLDIETIESLSANNRQVGIFKN